MWQREGALQQRFFYYEKKATRVINDSSFDAWQLKSFSTLSTCMVALFFSKESKRGRENYDGESNFEGHKKNALKTSCTFPEKL